LPFEFWGATLSEDLVVGDLLLSVDDTVVDEDWLSAKTFWPVRSDDTLGAPLADGLVARFLGVIAKNEVLSFCSEMKE
jgi:hypothetical protein